MPKTGEPTGLEVGHLVPPRVYPGGYENLVALLAALEDHAPEAIESLRDDVLLPTIERLGTPETGAASEGRWSGVLEQWQKRWNLGRWKSEHHSRSFSSVLQLFLAGMETTRKSSSEDAWTHWKSTIGLALSPGVVALSEWRLLEAEDPDLAAKLTIQPPTLRVWNPALESWSTWKAHALQQLAGYRKLVEDTFLQHGAERRPTKRKTQEHFEWLVRYQVREEEYESMARAIDDKEPPTDGDTEARIRKAVQDTARLIGLALRRGPGRPPSSRSASS